MGGTNKAFEPGLELTGFQKNCFIPDDQDFEIATLPTTRTGKSKVFPGRGVKLNYLYYWSDEFGSPENERKK
jgi:putative transposase